MLRRGEPWFGAPAPVFRGAQHFFINKVVHSVQVTFTNIAAGNFEESRKVAGINGDHLYVFPAFGIGLHIGIRCLLILQAGEDEHRYFNAGSNSRVTRSAKW